MDFGPSLGAVGEVGPGTNRPWILRDKLSLGKSKVIWRFLTVWGSASLTPTLVKGQLYILINVLICVPVLSDTAN